MSRSPAAALCLAALAALAGCTEKPEVQPVAPVRFEGQTAVLAEADKASFLKLAPVERDDGGVLRLPGRLVWNDEKTARVFPQVAGRIQRIAADVGDRVKPGDVLATLDAPEHGQALAEARKARAEAQLAAQALERNRTLREAGVIAEKDWQQSEAAAASARAEAERAARRLAGLGGDGNGAYVLRSPLAGTVVERNINAGTEFRPDQAGPPLFVITDPGSLWLRLEASEEDLAHLKPGETLRIEAKAYPGEQFKGVIRHVADFVDPATRTVRVRGEVPNAERRLKGEMFVSALIDLPPSPALRVPAAAVFLLGNRRCVFVAEAPGRYRLQAIAAGRERDGRIDVNDGLKAGDSVVAEGSLHLLKYYKPAAASDRQAAK